MSSPADLAIQRVFGNADINPSDLAEATCLVILELLSLSGGLVSSDNPNYVEACVQYVAENCSHSQATDTFATMMAPIVNSLAMGQ